MIVGCGYVTMLMEPPNDRNTRARACRGMLFLSPIIDICDEIASLSYFIHRFVVPYSADSFPNNMTCLPSILTHDGQSLLEITTLSVAQMANHNQLGCDRLRVQSYRNYGRAIGMLQDTISSGQGVTDDKVLAAAVLLCRFKDISGEGFGDPSEHASGLYSLLEIRGIEQLATKSGFELYILSLLRLVRLPPFPQSRALTETLQLIYSFLHDDDTYSDPGRMEQCLGFFDPLMRAMSLTTKMLHLRHALVRCTSSMQQSIDTLSPGSQRGQEAEDVRLLQDCFQTLYESDLWDEEAAVYWRNTFEGRVAPIALGRIATGSHYYDSETACTIILIRSLRLILLISMLGYLERTQQDLRGWHYPVGAGWTDCLPALEHDVCATIDDMLLCVPYALAKVDASGQP
ncbi:hypothetical protein IL306_004304 [Fusarium sp. DS 682]|nr:hypothetical protein IL306_004304 [Fusarium sp. DS 682]